MGPVVGAILGLILVVWLGVNGVVDNDVWLFAGLIGGSVAGAAAQGLLNVVGERITVGDGSRPASSTGRFGTVTLHRTPLTREESAGIHTLEMHGLLWATGLAVAGVAAWLIGQRGFAIAAGVIALVFAGFSAWQWLTARDQTAIWATGSLGLTRHIDWSRRSPTRICKVWAGAKGLEIDCSYYDGLAELATEHDGLLGFSGLVEFLPGSDLLIRVESPAGTVRYAREGFGPERKLTWKMDGPVSDAREE
jgi:hypothetical protein